MRAVTKKFTNIKIGISTNSLPVLLFFLIFISGCKVFSSSMPNDTLVNNELRDSIISYAKELLGTKYKYSGIKPKSGFDCSGFVFFIYGNYNIDLPHSSKAQSKLGIDVSIKNAKPGDLIFFKKRKSVDHVGIVVENLDNELWVVHSTNTRGVILEDVKNSDYWQKKIFSVKDVISKN